MIAMIVLWLLYFNHQMEDIGSTEDGSSLSEIKTVETNYYLYIIIPVAIVVLLIIFYFLWKRFGKIICHLIFKKDAYHPIGPSGLRNIKEYCYMNSMIQAMASSKKLIKEYESIIEKLGNEDKCQKMILFTNLLRNVNSPDSGHCLQENTASVKNLMESVNWNRTSQEDTFQVLSSFINGIEKDIKEELKKENITMPPKFKLLHTFTESSDYNKVQDHLALALPLCGDFRNVPGVKLNSLMDAFFQPSPIDDGQYSTQMFFFEKVPDVLILHIQANEWDDNQGTYIKPKYYVRYKDNMEYEFNIHLKKDGSEIMKVKEVYKLTAVVHHMGTISEGHYITYRTHEGVWYLTNDEQVEEVSFNFDKVPYVMVYEKFIYKNLKKKYNKCIMV